MHRNLLSPEEKLLRRKASLAKYRLKHSEKIKEYLATYRLENKEAIQNQKKLYKQSNRHLNAKYSADYHASKLRRTVNWDIELTSFVLEEAHHLRGMRDVLTGFKWDVDHIVPLRGKTVSGLHVWNNFAVIPMSINRSKKNEYSH